MSSFSELKKYDAIVMKSFLISHHYGKQCWKEGER